MFSPPPGVMSAERKRIVLIIKDEWTFTTTAVSKNSTCAVGVRFEFTNLMIWVLL